MAKESLQAFQQHLAFVTRLVAVFVTRLVEVFVDGRVEVFIDGGEDIPVGT
jgi:hypothetical protein